MKYLHTVTVLGARGRSLSFSVHFYLVVIDSLLRLFCLGILFASEMISCCCGALIPVECVCMCVANPWNRHHSFVNGDVSFGNHLVRLL